MIDIIKSVIIRVNNIFLRKVAPLWLRVYRVQNLIVRWKYRHGRIAVTLSLLVFVGMSFYFSPELQNILEDYYSTEQSLQGVRNLIQSIGIALISASAIVTSLVLFAMQVNVERMPHGLFHRLSTDKLLLGAFALTFLLAVSIAILSIFITQVRLAFMVISTGWLIVFIFILFVYAYRRALKLINPLQQLEILINDSRKELRIWRRWAKRMSLVIKTEEKTDDRPPPATTTHDWAQALLFRNTPDWDKSAKQKIQHAISLARRYAEQGDYDVSEYALVAIININKAYIDAKGKTFYADNLLFDNSLTHDEFITNTLEHLRKNMQHGIARQDEQQIEQILQAMVDLVKVYLDIDYSAPNAQKTHANLAASYLGSAVSSIIPHNMTDVLLKGQRCMGEAAINLFVRGRPSSRIILSEKIFQVACRDPIKKEYWPVTMEGMRQLSKLTIASMRHSENRNARFVFSQIHEHVANIVRVFLTVPDQPLLRVHSSYLGPYYFSTDSQSFLPCLTALANEILNTAPDDANARKIIHNIEQWADQIHKTKKELLLQSIEAKSSFASDIIYWIKQVTGILLAVSKANACDAETGKNLRRHAHCLITTLNCIPKDQDTVNLIESYRMTETLFEVAIDAYRRGCDDIVEEIGEILLYWTFKAGRYQTGFDTLKTGICGFAVFALMRDEEEIIRSRIQAYLSGDSAPNQEIRDRTAQQIRHRVAPSHSSEEYFHLQIDSHSQIEKSMREADQGKLRPILKDIAEMLSPSVVK